MYHYFNFVNKKIKLELRFAALTTGMMEWSNVLPEGHKFRF
jgi:hypothetical protein